MHDVFSFTFPWCSLTLGVLVLSYWVFWGLFWQPELPSRPEPPMSEPHSTPELLLFARISHRFEHSAVKHYKNTQ